KKKRAARGWVGAARADERENLVSESILVAEALGCVKIPGTREHEIPAISL
ncbi:MAG: hypothetical protein QOD60_2186, partial [Solirubrobacterales bacterium]|nr:hypothetical protein [Solirubrobacterales bacterium]